MKKFILFTGRHAMPEEAGNDAIFADINPVDFIGMDKIAYEKISKTADKNICLYVTGLTAATVAVVKACLRHRKNLVLMHYDKGKNLYVSQDVL